MLDAGAAVTSAAATAVLQASIAVSPTAPQPAQVVTFNAAGTTLPVGRSVSSYLWVLTNGGGIVSSFIGATDGAAASATPTGAGTFSVRLTVTDNTGAQSTATSTVTVAAVPVAPPAASAGDGGGGGGGAGGGWLALLAATIGALLTVAGRRRHV